MSDLKICFLISMFDEHDYVKETISNIRSYFNNAHIAVCHSDNGIPLDNIADKYIVVENLESKVEKLKLPSYSICRNFSLLFSHALNYDFDLIVCLTGDTLIYDPSSFERRFEEMKQNKWMAYVSKPVNQKEHDKNGNLWAKTVQMNDYDFICCMFMINGNLAKQRKCFTDIKIINEYTSEECLGNELERFVNLDQVGLLNKNDLNNCYSYNDGIRWHIKNGGPGR